MSEQDQDKQYQTSDIDNEVSHKRGIRSYVLRQGHMSDAQKAAMAEGLPKWGIEYQPETIDLNAVFGRDNDNWFHLFLTSLKNS